MAIKILGIAGSPRHGNTDIMVKTSLEAAASIGGVETEFFSTADFDIKPCTSCYKCTKTTMEHLCLSPEVRNDDANMLFKKMIEADGWLVGVPVYFGSIPAQFKALVDRSMSVEMAGYGFRNKVAGALTVAFDRNGGLERTITDLQSWFLIHDMIPVSVGPERPDQGIGCYWGATCLQGWPYPVHSTEMEKSLEGVKQDVIGMQQSAYLGKRVAEMAKVVRAGFENVETVWPYKGI
ncbi:MAG: flavodoxin family protein [Deltaproteobacteria bacterium]|nr:flavodoxin family protein [Deltaproteobacteria bacterium]